eukprot:TRINITY_DN8337_c0_g1_i6.p1 TRINITY_DN8337_c0_g1~~TRINITY_DN8337_c0_g1_i6.p1  ORF type:complete len:300 (-),score=44.81 TRINITY_DN8337_c0_g1_i6:398-1297(-)
MCIRDRVSTQSTWVSKLIVESITADEILNLLKNVLLRKQFQFGVKSVDARNRSAFIINYSIDGKVVSEQFTQTIHKEKEGHWIIFEHQKGELLRYFEVKPLVGGSVMLSMITTLSSHQYRHRNPANHPYLLASIANFLNGNYLGDRRVVVRSKRVLKSAATWDNLIQSQSVSMIEEKKEDELPVSNPREDSKAAKYLQMGEEMIQQLISTAKLIPDNRWVFETEKRGMTCHTNIDESGLSMTRGEGVVDIPVLTLKNYLTEAKHSLEFDKLVENVEILEKIMCSEARIEIIWQVLYAYK